MLAHKRLNVIVTGGSRGLGAGLVRHFSGCGDRVLSLSTMQCDVGNARDFRRYVDKVHEEVFEGEPIHLWINNAAMSGGYTKFVDLSDEEVEKIVRTNILGTMIGTKKAIEMIEGQNEPGCIVNVTGAGADFSTTPFFSVYGATKSTVVQFTNTIAQEIPYKNTAFALLSPGMLNTELLFQNVPERLRGILEVVAEDPEYAASMIGPMIKDAYAAGRRQRSGVRFLRLLDVKRVLQRLVKKLVQN